MGSGVWGCPLARAAELISSTHQVGMSGIALSAVIITCSKAFFGKNGCTSSDHCLARGCVTLSACRVGHSGALADFHEQTGREQRVCIEPLPTLFLAHCS